MNKFYEKFPPKRLFFALSALLTLASVVSLIATRGAILVDLGFGNDGYMDFFNHVVYVENPAEVYFVSEHACFPPLVYLMYLLFNRILPEGSIRMYNEDVAPEAMLLYVLYVALTTVLFYCAANKFLGLNSRLERFFALSSILLSNIFIFGILERGNSTFLVLIALLYALYLKDSESPVKREIALILIAVAAGIKVYPAVFGLLYIREKRWKEAARLIGYGIIFFFLPFVFFGGLDGAKQFLANQSQVHNMYPAKTIYSINALFCFMSGQTQESVWATVAVVSFGALMLAAFFFLPLKKWQQYFGLSVAIILLPLWSGYYTMVYLALPLLAMLNESEQSEGRGVLGEVISYFVYAAFAVIFSLTIVLEQLSADKTEYGRYMEYNMLYALIIAVLALGIYELIRRKFNGKSKT